MHDANPNKEWNPIYSTANRPLAGAETWKGRPYVGFVPEELYAPDALIF